MTSPTMLLEHDSQSSTFNVSSDVLHPPMRIHEIGENTLYIFGHPIYSARRDDNAIKQGFAAASKIDDLARNLDGNFLIIVRNQKLRRLQIISDRFASHALYFAQRGGTQLVASLSLINLVRRLGGFLPNKAAFIEFLHFRRLFGEKTYDSRCQYLGAASILEHNLEGCAVRKYWQPEYQKPRLTSRAASDAIVDSLLGTMRSHMENADNGRRYALFMSGGLDSRALLAAAAEPPICVTTCQAFNNEAEVAQDVARTAGAPFRFVARPATAYDAHVDDAIYCGNGEHIFTEAHFIGYQPILGGYADCFFLGLGLDVFLGGLYLPKSPARWFGRDALHFGLVSIDDDMETAFCAGVKYRLKASDPWDIIKADSRSQLYDAMRESIGEIAARGRARGASGYDLWEYLHLHNFSRHYSFLMIDSVRRWAECRAPAFCNDLLDIAVALPADLKVNSRAYLAALNRLAPELMKIRNANTNIAAGMPLQQQSVVRAGRIVANKFGANYRVSPGRPDRSWPAPAEVLRSSAELVDLTKTLPGSAHLGSLGIFEMNEIGKKVDDHFANRSDESILLFMLVTLDGFLRQVH